MNPKFEDFRRKITNPLTFRFFMLQKLPAAFVAGLRVRDFDTEKLVVTVSHKWLNQNPFKSMYFAVQSMAAEMSTGMLVFAQVYKRNPAVSMLVVGMEGKFHKKVVDKVAFTCTDGKAVEQAVELALATGEGQTIKCYTIGKNPAGEIVSEFWFTWSFKSKQK